MAADIVEFRTASAQLPKLTQGPGGLFFRSQLLAKAQYPPKGTSLSGQTAIITGGNTGIGFACAGMLLDLGLTHLILAVRSQTKGGAAAKSLREMYPQSKASIEVWLLDMGSYSSIQSFAERCRSLPRIDVAILNAGIMQNYFKIDDATGHNETIQINFLSTMLLCILLLPIMRPKIPTGKPGRITIVISSLAMFAKFSQHSAKSIIGAFDVEENVDINDLYDTSKFLVQLFLDKLAQFVSPDDVIVNCVDPGYVKGTSLHRSIQGRMAKSLFSISKELTGRKPKDAATTYIDAAIIKGKESHGSYLMDWKIAPYGEFYYRPERPDVQNRLWDEVMEEFRFADAENIILAMERK